MTESGFEDLLNYQYGLKGKSLLKMHDSEIIDKQRVLIEHLKSGQFHSALLLITKLETPDIRGRFFAFFDLYLLGEIG